MKSKFIALFLFLLPMVSFTGIHKFYVSNTEIAYVEEKEEVQIISRYFIDDMERLIRERYEEGITLAESDEPERVNQYIDKYLKEKLTISINGKPRKLQFIGKEYEDDMVWCYLEISDVKAIESIEISNKALFDVFPEQQNVIRINSKRKSFVCILENDKALLNFN